MQPGPYEIVACPHCQGQAKHMTLISGNTFGARVWTDGKQIAPMLPRPPAVVECRHCGGCYRLADAEVVGTLDPWAETGQEEVNAALATVQSVQEPKEEKYYQALQGELAKDSQQEKNLRILAWWRRNDAYRHFSEAEAGFKAEVEVSSLCRENLEALARLLNDEDGNERIMKAEVLRELGEFDSAIRVLDEIGDGEHAEVVRQLTTLCERGDICVRELQFDS